MKALYIGLATMCSLGLNAQSLSPSVISSGGAFSSNANGSLSYTVGEMSAIQTLTAGNSILTQGFQQPNEQLTRLLDLSTEAYGSFAVYPNPAVEHLWYGFQFPESGKASLTVYDALGQIMAEVKDLYYQSGKTIEQLSVSQYAAGSYSAVIKFTNSNGIEHSLLKKFSVIK